MEIKIYEIKQIEQLQKSLHFCYVAQYSCVQFIQVWHQFMFSSESFHILNGTNSHMENQMALSLVYCAFVLNKQCAFENLFCSQNSIAHLIKSSQLSVLLKHFGPVACLYFGHLYQNNKLLQLTVHNSVRYIFYTKESQAVLLHARYQCNMQSFYTISSTA